MAEHSDNNRSRGGRPQGDGKFRNKGGFKPNRGGRPNRNSNKKRGGSNWETQRGPHSGPQRAGYREERLNKRLNEPDVPNDLDPKELDPSVRQELRSLSKDNADMVAKHLIMAATLLDDDPDKALAHARAAKDRAGRVSVARETCGIVAYHAGEWKEAIAELRAARRMAGGPGLLPVLADAERGLGKPEKALEVANDPQADQLDAESKAELAIVVAGAHQDLDHPEEALLALEAQLDNADAPDVTRMRLFYAYADALATAERKDEAIEWFRRAEEMDTEEILDVPDRLAELGVEPDEDK
ncbi:MULTISPECIES: hypothetical protein [Corynebacterium]|uniref:hypothetical protein n=1 Tax=Corynebacterium TaxID=1716 RepID=UPI0005B4364B|nr:MULTISPECIES: hypothetical protein [Corynebacterium]MBC6795907.1 hypothetical protein [Corynebacterium sp. LK28]MDK8868985.1 tetratricopeptide repeat protein [Corynebacterium macclintockiae]